MSTRDQRTPEQIAVGDHAGETLKDETVDDNRQDGEQRQPGQINQPDRKNGDHEFGLRQKFSKRHRSKASRVVSPWEQPLTSAWVPSASSD